MRLPRRRLILIATVLVVAGVLTVWCASHTEVWRAHSDFQWFSTLGFPDVKDCSCVRVATGRWSQTGDDPPQNNYANCFLLSSNANSFAVLMPDLTRCVFTNTATDVPEHQRVGFEVMDLRRVVEVRLRELRNPDARNPWRRFGSRMSEDTEIFMLAWGCWRHGLESEALTLYQEARRLQQQPPSVGVKTPFSLSVVGSALKERFQKMLKRQPGFRERIEKAIAHKLMWDAVVNFEDPSITRPELLRQFETILKNYPHTEHRERARITADVLRRMIAEGDAHARSGPIDLARLSKDEQVRELIFRLRDQNGRQISQPGWCDIFADWQSTNTAAHQLVNQGYAAVPQLIAALDSDTFTRSVGYHRDFYFSHTVLTVGDCAASILQRITGRSFSVPISAFSAASKDEHASAARQAAQAWWTEFQKKGEQQMLVNGVRIGNDDAPGQATLLRLRYPTVATPALVEGIRAATNSWIRRQLVEELAKINNQQALEFLGHELLEGPDRQGRVVAAYALRPHNRDTTIQAMINEWESSAATNSTQDPAESETEPVITFLAGCDSLKAISALAHDLSRRPVAERLNVIEALGETNSWDFQQTHETPSPAVLKAMEECLVTALKDTEQRTGMSGTRNGKSFSDPRICDMAAYFLSERWPDRYSFDLAGSLPDRDRQRLECLDTWSKAHNSSPGQ
jgi:hypothetical protein